MKPKSLQRAELVLLLFNDLCRNSEKSLDNLGDLSHIEEIVSLPGQWKQHFGNFHVGLDGHFSHSDDLLLPH